MSNLGAVDTFRLPAEWEPHANTFLAWPECVRPEWKGDLDYLMHEQENVARVAEAILPFEPVVVLVSPGKEKEAKEVLDPLVTLMTIPVNDLWTRDCLPAFVFKSTKGRKDEICGVDLNFNAYGDKIPTHVADRQISQLLSPMLKIERLTQKVVAEGGGIETDGQGTFLATESSILNANRNPGLTKAEVEAEFSTFLGMRKMIWLKGIIGEDISDTHVDCLARFVAPGKVILHRPFGAGANDPWSKCSDDALKTLKSAHDATGKALEVIELPGPNPANVDDMWKLNFAASYVNFLIVNNGVIFPTFGDVMADFQAEEILKLAFPERVVVPVNSCALASGGGNIHCATHQYPLLP